MLLDLGRDLLTDAKEPAQGVVPLAAYLVLFAAYAQWMANLPVELAFEAEMLLGVPCVVAGLAMFKWGLRKGLMPWGEMLGEKLPSKVGELGVSAISFVLAVGLTFAEPAIGALQEAASLLDATSAPLLSALFGTQKYVLLLVLAIGFGVGIAAVTGALRLLYAWDIKRMIFWALVPCLLATLVWNTASENLASVVGLAWDGGAVTTGPVTVPVVISLGIGLATGSRLRQSVRVLQQEGMEMSGGVHVRLKDGPDDDGGQSPDAELLRDVQQGERDELEGFGIVTFASLWPVLGVLLLGGFLTAAGAAEGASEAGLALAESAPDHHRPGVPEALLALRSIGPLMVGLGLLQRFVIAEALPNLAEVVLGILCILTGLVLFNLGLNFGLLPLGHAAGEQMALAFEACVQQDRSRLGLAMVLCFAFVGTFAAQVAEPALNVLGETVERLTKGAFRRRHLVYVVALGVAVGTCVGVLKVLWDLPMWKILVPMYLLSFALTIYSSDGITAVAWDAGGVTTGSVTVPLILAIGLGLGKKRDPPVSDGFGLLGCASVFPILAVLLTGLVLDRPQRRVIQQIPELG